MKTAIGLLTGLLIGFTCMLYVYDSEKKKHKEMKHRYGIIYGYNESEGMKAIETYIFTGEGRNEALRVNVIEELEQ